MWGSSNSTVLSTRTSAAAWFNNSENHLFLNLERNDADAALDGCQHVLGGEWPNDDAAAEPMMGHATGVGGRSINQCTAIGFRHPEGNSCRATTLRPSLRCLVSGRQIKAELRHSCRFKRGPPLFVTSLIKIQEYPNRFVPDGICTHRTCRERLLSMAPTSVADWDVRSLWTSSMHSCRL